MTSFTVAEGMQGRVACELGKKTIADCDWHHMPAIHQVTEHLKIFKACFLALQELISVETDK